MDIHQIKMLIEGRQEPCISIYMPTHQKGKETEQDPIRFKNLIKQTENYLKEEGFRDSRINEFLIPAKEILTDSEFWNHQSEGLAAFIANNEFHHYRLPLRFKEYIAVSHRFHIKPLLQLIAIDGKFYLLSLSKKKVRLFQGSRYSIGGLDFHDTPLSLEEALQYDDPERQIQYHTGTGERKGRRAAIFHGQGTGTDDAQHKKDLQRFLKMVNDGVNKTLVQKNVPLVIAGVEMLTGYYRDANSYPNLAEKEIQLQPDSLSMDELHRKAWEIVEPTFRKDQQKAFDQYGQLRGTGRASNDLKQILQASHEGRVEVLFVDAEREIRGQYDPDSTNISIHEKMQSGNEDLLDLTLVQTISHKGFVYTLPSEKIPDEVPIAAIFRF